MSHASGMHAMLGTIVVLLNVIVGLLLLKDRREHRSIGAGKKAVAYLGQLLLLVQILVGFDLWSRGARPAAGFWAFLHLILPLGALVFAVMMLRRMRGSAKDEHATLLSKAGWHTAAVSIVTYIIGTVG